MSGLWLGYKIGFRKATNTKNQRSTAREQEEEATKYRAENEQARWRIQIIFKQKNQYLARGYSCTRDTVCMQVTYTIVTVHAICEGLRNTVKITTKFK